PTPRLNHLFPRKSPRFEKVAGCIGGTVERRLGYDQAAFRPSAHEGYGLRFQKPDRIAQHAAAGLVFQQQFLLCSEVGTHRPARQCDLVGNIASQQLAKAKSPATKTQLEPGSGSPSLRQMHVGIRQPAA
ncbi:conserved hypothetical protein, partial [Ricinus communis]